MYYNVIEAKTYNFYTQFSFFSSKALDHFLSLLSSPISSNAYEKELGRIEDELIDVSMNQKLFQTLLIHFNMNLKTRKTNVSLKQLNDYKDKYYVNPVVLNRNFFPISQTFMLKGDVPTKFSNFHNTHVREGEVEYCVTYNTYDSNSSYYEFDFLYSLFSAWLDYYTYHKEALYYPYSIYSYHTLDYNILCYPL